jgi:UDP-2,3-diacylglucosamine hydrolase
VPAYFASDIHLRLDRPERSRRFARWVQELNPPDSLTVVGDLCDFWFASRQRRKAATLCEGLAALADFSRRSSGAVTLLAGNHDATLGEYYQRELKLRWNAGSLDLVAHGVRIHAVHGHRLGAQSAWKGFMETDAFLRSFGALPHPLAVQLEHLLDWKNERGREACDQRHLAAYRRYADQLADRADIVVLGHVHRMLDTGESRPRIVVLGDWLGDKMSYLRVDETGATLHAASS